MMGTLAVLDILVRVQAMVVVLAVLAVAWMGGAEAEDILPD